MEIAKGVVSEVYSPPRVALAAERLGVSTGMSLDLTTCDENGEAWDFSKPKKQAKKKRTREEYAAHLSERKERGDAKRAKNAVAPGATPLLLDASRAAAAFEMDSQP